MINDFVKKIEDLHRLAKTCTDLLRLAWRLKNFAQPFLEDTNDYRRTWGDFFFVLRGKERRQQQQQQQQQQQRNTTNPKKPALALRRLNPKETEGGGIKTRPV